MTSWLVKPFARYGFALIVSAVAVGAGALTQLVAQGRSPFLTSFVAVAVVASFAGPGPAVVTMLVSGSLAVFLWLLPYTSGEGIELASAFGVFVLAASLVLFTCERLRRLRAEHQRAEALLKTLVDNTPGIIYMKDDHGVLRMLNRRFAELIGRRESEIVGVREDAFFDPASLAIIRENDRRVFSNDGPLQFEESLQLPDGEHFFLSIKVPLTFEGERVLVGFSTDITEWKRAEKALREAEETLVLAQESAGIGVWEIDAREGSMVASPSLWKLVNRDPIRGAVPRSVWLGFIHEDDREILERRLREAIAESAFSLESDVRIVLPDGSVRWLASRVRLEWSSAGELVRVRGASFDVTEARLQRERRQELLQAERVARSEAERASRLKDEFLATLSHELRTPLTSILGWSNLLRSGEPTRKMLEKGLETIERNARAQTRLIEDLLDMSRIMSGKVRLDAQPVSMTAIVSAAEEALQSATAAKRIELATTVDPNAVVLGDPTRLQQVLLNLLTNSIKFTEPGGCVRVEVWTTEGGVRLRVSDTGVGIAPEFLPYVFDRFRQADASCTRVRGGLGLGLSIVKHLVELHGGTVTAESEGIGKGAQFTVELPSCSAMLATESVNDRPVRRRSASPLPFAVSSGQPLSGIRTLVVDDDDDSRELLGRVLEDSGARVFLARSAADALAILRDHRFDVVVSDIGMPDRDGYDFIRDLRALPPERGGNTPAVALTAFVRPEDKARAIGSGFQLHVSKPVNPVELVSTLAQFHMERSADAE